jgi:hypothetical protein
VFGALVHAVPLSASSIGDIEFDPWAKSIRKFCMVLEKIDPYHFLTFFPFSGIPSGSRAPAFAGRLTPWQKITSSPPPFYIPHNVTVKCETS